MFEIGKEVFVMDRQLELVDIAMYLPYNLKAQTPIGEVVEVGTLNDGCYNIKGRSSHYGMYGDISDIKPLLRPLSDLDISKLPAVPEPANMSPAVIFTDKTVEMCYWREYTYLIENLFDINGLIEAGLAIDINTVKPC